MKLKNILSPSEKTISIIIGLGLALFPVHNKQLTFGTDSETIFFLPWLGFGLILIGLIMLFDNKYDEFKKYIGPKILYIPLLVIVASAILRIAIEPSGKTFASACILCVFFALYVAARKLGTQILWAFVPFVFIEAVSCIIQGIIDPGYRAGGILTSFRTAEHTANYDIAACWLILGTCLILGLNKGLKLRFLFLVAVALYFVAAEEAIVAILGLSIAALIRKDISKKVIIPVLAVLILLGAGSLTGMTQDLYKNTYDKVQAAASEDSSKWDDSTTGRVTVYKDALNNTAPLGHGMELVGFTTHTVHNLPLILWDQIGPISALAWLWVVFYCFLKTSWKYIWVAFLCLCIWDHYLWSQCAPWFWVIVGLSTTVVIDDHIFKRNNDDILVNKNKVNN